MSSGGSRVSGRSPGGREVAHRIFAAEFGDATYTFSRGDDERAPKYVVSPTGALMNRVFVVGVMTDVEQVNEETVRARIADPTGVFVIYASQYQPDARAAIQDLQPPAFVAVTGKANTFVPTGGDRAFTSIRPEAIAAVDADTRDHWTVTTAQLTLDRLAALGQALEGDGTPSEGVGMAIDQYDIAPAYLSDLYTACVEALEVVNGERDSVDTIPDLATSGEGDTSIEEIVTIGRSMGGDSSDADPVPSQPGTSPAPASTTEPVEPVDEDVSEPGHDLDEPVVSADEREAIEAEFGTDFTTGEDIESPEEPPEPESEPQSEPAHEQDEDEALSDRLVDLLHELDSGEGVSRETLLETGCERFGEDEESVGDAIRTAMMDGQCYEPAEDVLKPV